MPVWYRNQPLYIQSGTYLLVDSQELSPVPCNTTFSSVFKTDEGIMVQATPSVSEIDLDLTHIDGDYLHVLDTAGPIEHTSFGNEVLYTNEEIESFNSLIHFNRAKSHVIDSLVKKYCAKGDCGSYQPDVGGPKFNIANLGEDLITIFS